MTRLLTLLALAVLIVPLHAQSPNPVVPPKPDTTAHTWESTAWGKLPAGLAWEAASQVSTTPEGQIVVLRRANPFFVVLTPAGRDSIEAAAPDHVDEVRRSFLDALSPSQVEALAGITAAVLRHLDAAEDAESENSDRAE